MNNILQWEPEKTRLWGSARIENVLRIRDDLAHLADWIKSKADTAALGTKADVAKLAELEKTLAQARLHIDSTKKEAEKATARLSEQIVALETWAKGSQIEAQLQSVCDGQLKTLDALGSQYHDCLEQLLASSREVQAAVEGSLAQCRQIEQGFAQVELEARRQVSEGVQSIKDKAESTAQNAEQAKSAAEHAAAIKTECEELIRSLAHKSEELIRSWQSVQGTLGQLSSQTESNALKAAEHSQAARETLSECQATADRAQQLRAVLDGEQKEASERIAALVQQAETHAASAQQNSHLTVAASDLVGGLKAECESLIHSLRLKGDELGATWEGVRQSLTTLSLTTQQHASHAHGAVEFVEKALADAQAHTQVSQQLHATLQTEQQQVGQRLAALDEMLEQVGSKVNASAEHVQACEKIRSEVGDAQLEVKTLRQSLEDQIRQTKQSRDDVEALRQELRQHISTLQLNSLTLGRRLHWLFFGYRSR